MPVQITKRLLTVTEYQKMGEVGILQEQGIELINGEIVERSPVGSKHLACVNKLNALLCAMLGEKAIVSVQNPVIAGDNSAPEPDISILKYRKDFYVSKVPYAKDVLLVIEVADSSFEYDRTIKLPIYAQSGIPEYWLINLEKDEIEAYWEPAGNTYRFRELLRAGDVLAARGMELEVEVGKVF
ncbi:MAG: Uma2 family endonuclease [Saprospirales bacterium]|nr:Uma2 family endonuclease [Saprospirales bacterium]